MGAAGRLSSEGFGRVDLSGRVGRSGRVGPVARAVWPRSAAPALLARLVAVAVLAAVWVVAARLVVVWLLLVVVWVRVLVDSAIGEEVMVVADRALADAGGAVRAAAVPDGRSTGRAGSPVRAHARAADAADAGWALSADPYRAAVAGSTQLIFHRSQPRWPAASVYPTNATVSMSPCAITSGQSRPVRHQAYPNTRPITTLPRPAPKPW